MSRICVELDVTLEAFRARSLEHFELPYVYLDTTYVKARVGSRVVSRAMVVATGIGRTRDGASQRAPVPQRFVSSKRSRLCASAPPGNAA